jgi:hypothetical protein
MTRTPYSSGRLPFDSKVSSSLAARRRNLRSQASRLTLRSTVAAAAFVGLGVFAPSEAWAQCVVGGVTVTCADTSTTDTTFPANPPVDRAYQGAIATPIILNVNSGATVSGNGLAVTNSAGGGITVANGGTISVDAGNTPTAGGTAALSLTAAGGPIVYTGGDIINNGNGNALDARQTGGVGSVNITAGAIFSAAGEGVFVRDVAGSTGISVTTGAVTALTVGKDGIDAQSQSLTGNITEVANGDINAGNAGMVAAILNAGATGSIDVTANGAMTARFGVDAENFGSGNTFVTTIGPVNVTNGNGIFALATGGHVIVNAGDVTSVSNTAIIAQQTKAAGAGLVGVTAGNVSGTTGIDVHNFGSGDIGVVANGTVTGTAAEGITAVGNAGIFVSVSNTVTGATRGLSLTGGTGGTGDIFVTGSGGFVGGSGDAVNIKNNGAGGVTVNISGASSSTGGEGFVIRDTAVGGNISVTTGAVTALTVGKDGIDVQTQSTTANVTEVANGDINAGNAGMVAAILNAANTGNINVTANGAMTARFGVDAENFGSGSTSVTTVGPVNVTNGNGIFALATGGDVTVNAGDVTSISNTAIVAQQTKAAGTGWVIVGTTGNVSGTAGIDARNFGSGLTGVTANGAVNATTGAGISALSNGGDVIVNTGDVTSTGNTAIIAQQTNAAGTGAVIVGTTGNVSGTTGIDAQNLGTGLTAVVAGGTVTGTAAEGIKAVGNAGVIVTAFDTVTGATRGLSLIGGTGGAGDILVNGPGGFFGGTGDAVNIKNNGSGTVTVALGGASGSTGGEGIVIRDTAAGGSISVTTGAVTALAASKDGIDVQTQTLTGDVTIVANGDIKAGNAGIVAALIPGAGTGNVDVTANGAIDARFGIDAENFGSGNTTVTTFGPINATSGNGIFAKAAGGNVTVTAGDVTSTGNTAVIARQTNAAGAGIVDVTVGNVSGSVGVEATNSGTGAINVTANGTVTGTGGEGIIATGNDAVTISAADTVTGATSGLLLTGGTGGAGNISVTGTGFFGGTGNAVNIKNNGTGTVTVDISGASGSTSGEGIVVRDTAAGGSISVTTGAVTALAASKDGIDVQTQTLTGDVTIVANGDIKAGNAGIVAALIPGAGTGNVDVTANGAIDARFGIDAENFGSGNTTVTAVGPINATSGNGIFAKAAGGNVTVTAGDVTSTGNTAVIARQTNAAGAGIVDVTVGNVSGSVGVEATNSGTGAINVTANGTVNGTGGEGIIATGNDAVTISAADTVTGATSGLTLVGGTGGAGNILVTGTGGFFGGTGDGANIKNNGTGTVTVDISGASGSTSGNGIIVRDTAVGGDISVTTGAVTALAVGKNAIDVITQSTTANVTEVANGDINAGNAGMVGAILNAAATGNVDVTANGAITARFGVDAENFGTGSTSVTTVGPVNVTTGNGIYALTKGGNVSVNAGDVTATGNTAIIGRQTNAAGAGSINLIAGNVSGTTGIEATNSGIGVTNVVTTGTVTGTTAEGIIVTGNSSVGVLAWETVTGATRGLSLIGGTGGAGDIVVIGAGGFVGGTGDAANILNNGSGGVGVNAPGASSSTGGNGFFIRDTALGGNISLTTGAVTALAVGKNAIDVITQSTTANVTEVANGDIQAGNAGMVAAIFPAAATGNIDVTANGAITARFGVDAENFGTGNTTVTTVGPVNVTTGNGIYALTKGGNVSVNAGDVTSTGNTAIIGRQTNAAGTGSINLIAGNVSGTTGIEATNSGIGVTNVVTTGTVTGTAAEGIIVTGNSSVGVLAWETVTGATRGLSLIGGTGGAGDIVVIGAGGFVGGTGDAANILNNGSGGVGVNAPGASSSTGGNGFFIRDTAIGGDISLTTGAVTALAVGKNAIDVITQSTTANATEVANGDIQAGNAGMVAAIFPAAATGNIDVTANGAITARFGVDAENFGTGSTSVTTVGPVNVTTGNGIFALTRGGDVTVTAGDVTSTGNIAIIAQQTNAAGAGNIDVTAGNVSGTTGITAINSGTGTLGITTNGTVTGTAAEGISATGNDAVTVTAAGAVTGATNGLTLIGGIGGAGNILVTGTGGFFGGTGDGANIRNNGSGTTTVDISGASGSTGGNGIIVQDTAVGGDVSVTTGAVTALTPGFNGIDVRSLSTAGNLTVVANGDVQAGNAGIVAAIFPAAATGDIDVTANGAITARFGIDAENFGTGNTTVTTVGPVNVTTGNGIYAQTSGGNVTVTAGNVSSTGAAAIVAQQSDAAGAGTVGVTAGNVSGTTGIIAQTNGTGALSVNALGNVTATNGNGIQAINFNPVANTGTITVAQASGTKITATNGSGIYTDSGLSTGMTTITVAGEITAGTPGYAGIHGTSTKGGITVNVTGTGKIDPDYGIDLATVDGPLVVNNAGLVTGTIDGVRLVATGTGSANISNTGTITGGTNAVLISVNNTPSTLFNSGTINGAIKMLGSTVATSNWINSPTGIANLGTGASSISGNLVNGGNVNLGAGGTLTVLGNTNNAGRVTFAGAGTFTTAGSMTNTGIINARNNLTSNVVTVGGNYSGGGQFWADYSTNTVTADRLNIGGSATGNTNVTMNLVGTRSFVPGGFLPVVTVAGAAAGNAFTSSTPFPTTGFILDSFGQNPSNGHQFGVIQAVNPTAAGLGNLSYMAESASGLLDDPISPFVTNRTDAGGTRFSLWMRGSGGHSTQTISSSLTGGGLSYNATSRFRTSQHAAQIGADISFGGIGGGWKVNVGVMGGWYGASAPLAGGERLKVDTPFVGGYAVVGNGAFELEGNVRKEWRHYTVAMPSLFGTVGTQRMRGDATAGSARISYRIGGKTGFAATPFAAFNYADTKIDPLVLDAFTVWTPGSDTTKIGQAGLRLSYRGGSEATATFEPFISAARMENWSRGDSSSFAFGAPVTTFSLQSNTWKNAMRYSAGILANAHGSRVSGFVVGNIDDDARLRSFTIHAGLRFNF